MLIYIQHNNWKCLHGYFALESNHSKNRHIYFKWLKFSSSILILVYKNYTYLIKLLYSWQYLLCLQELIGKPGYIITQSQFKRTLDLLFLINQVLNELKMIKMQDNWIIELCQDFNSLNLLIYSSNEYLIYIHNFNSINNLKNMNKNINVTNKNLIDKIFIRSILYQDIIKMIDKIENKNLNNNDLKFITNKLDILQNNFLEFKEIWKKIENQEITSVNYLSINVKISKVMQEYDITKVN